MVKNRVRPCVLGGIALAILLALAAAGIWVVRPYLIERRTSAQPTALPTALPTDIAVQPIVTPSAEQPSPSPLPTPETTPESGPLAIASYDAEGNLQSVTGPAGKAIDDPAAAGFPTSLEESQGYLPFASVAQTIGQITTLEGAAFDDASGELVLIGHAVPGESLLTADDLLVALHSVAAGTYPGVSIDPGPTEALMQVRYLGPTAKTHFGEVMFEADRLLKTLSLGRDNVSGAAAASTVPGFESELDLAAANIQFGTEPDTEGVWHRFWYVVDRMRVSLSRDTHSISFVQSDLKVNTEYLGHDGQAVPGHAPNPEAQAFADFFSAHFAEFGREFPVVRELVELAKLVSVAQWMRDQGIPLDSTWLSMQAPAFVDTAETTPAITVTRELSRVTTTATQIQTETRIVMLYGGVDLTLQNEYESTSPDLGAEALNGRPSDEPSTWSLVSNTDGVERRAVAIPLQPAVQMEPQMVQAVDDLDLAAQAPVSLPFRRQYGAADSEPGELGYGWHFTLSRLEFPLEPQQYVLDSGETYTLYPEVVLFDGERRQRRRYALAALRSDGAIIYQADGGEELLLLTDGTYSVSRGMIDFIFDASGLLLRTKDLAGGGVEYQYADGRLARAETSSGLQIGLTYDGGRVTQITLGSKAVHYTYDARGDLVEVATDQGQPLWRYAYDTRHHLSREQDLVQGTERQLVYDDVGRLVAYGDSTGDYEVQHGPQAGVSIVRYARQVDRPIQAVAPVRAEFLLGAGVQAFRAFAGNRFDSDLTLFETIRRDESLPRGATLVYAARAGARQVALLVGDHYLLLPIVEASDPEILRSRLEQSGMLPAGGPVWILGPGRWAVDLPGALPGQRVLGSVGLDAAVLLGNYAALSGTAAPTRSEVAFVNAVPRNREQLEKAGLDPDLWDIQPWEGNAEEWDRVAAGTRTVGGGTDQAAAARAALAESANTVIIVAHSDGYSIRMPDGTILAPSTFDRDLRDLIRRNRPLVILLSCEAARMTDTPSLAEQLLDMGAKGVVAPEAAISAVTTQALLDSFLRNPGNYTNVLDVVLRAIEDGRKADPQNKDIHIQTERIEGRPVPG